MNSIDWNEKVNKSRLYEYKRFLPYGQHHVLFCSLAVLDPRVGHTMDALSPFISVLCHFDWLFHGEPVHVLMLSIQAVRGLPRLRAPGIVPCIISFSTFVSSWCDHSMLASLLWRCLTVPSSLQLYLEPTHLFSLLSTKPVVSLKHGCVHFVGTSSQISVTIHNNAK